MRDSLTVPEYLQKIKRLTTTEEKVVYLWMAPKIWSRDKHESVVVLVRMLCDEAEKGNEIIASEVKKIFARKVISMLNVRTMSQNPQTGVKDAVGILVYFFAQGINRNSIFNHPEEEDKILEFLGEVWHSSLDPDSGHFTDQIEQALIAYRLPPFLVRHSIVRLLPDLYRVLQNDQKEVDTLRWPHWSSMPIEPNGCSFFKTLDEARCLEKRLSSDPILFFDDCHKMLERAGSLIDSGLYHFLSRGVIALVAKAMYFRKQVLNHEWKIEYAQVM
jgi:hypothetical protein